MINSLCHGCNFVARTTTIYFTESIAIEFSKILILLLYFKLQMFDDADWRIFESQSPHHMTYEVR